jgi:heme A synthase
VLQVIFIANHMLLATLFVTSQMLYVANTTTFGCSSGEEVAKLQRIRPARKSFQTELYQQIFAGQCVEIAKGKVVEGSIQTGDSSILLVDRQIEPPGFLAPLRDFHKLKGPSGPK